jgi:hypothetical protein
MGYWRRLKGYRHWREAVVPMLYNEQTGEVRKFLAATGRPEGDWVLRRPLTLSESSKPLYLNIRLTQANRSVK